MSDILQLYYPRDTTTDLLEALTGLCDDLYQKMARTGDPFDIREFNETVDELCDEETINTVREDITRMSESGHQILHRLQELTAVEYNDLTRQPLTVNDKPEHGAFDLEYRVAGYCESDQEFIFNDVGVNEEVLSQHLGRDHALAEKNRPYCETCEDIHQAEISFMRRITPGAHEYMRRMEENIHLENLLLEHENRTRRFKRSERKEMERRIERNRERTEEIAQARPLLFSEDRVKNASSLQDKIARRITRMDERLGTDRKRRSSEIRDIYAKTDVVHDRQAANNLISWYESLNEKKRNFIYFGTGPDEMVDYWNNPKVKKERGEVVHDEHGRQIITFRGFKVPIRFCELGVENIVISSRDYIMAKADRARYEKHQRPLRQQKMQNLGIPYDTILSEIRKIFAPRYRS